MKTVKQILDNSAILEDICLPDQALQEGLLKKEKPVDRLAMVDSDKPSIGWPADKNIPVIILLKRKAIRVYPDNQKIALYYSQALNKYVSIPFGPKSESLGIYFNEETDLAESRKKSNRDSMRELASAHRNKNINLNTSDKEHKNNLRLIHQYFGPDVAQEHDELYQHDKKEKQLGTLKTKHQELLNRYSPARKSVLGSIAPDVTNAGNLYLTRGSLEGLSAFLGTSAGSIIGNTARGIFSKVKDRSLAKNTRNNEIKKIEKDEEEKNQSKLKQYKHNIVLSRATHTRPGEVYRNQKGKTLTTTTSKKYALMARDIRRELQSKGIDVPHPNKLIYRKNELPAQKPIVPTGAQPPPGYVNMNPQHLRENFRNHLESTRRQKLEEVSLSNAARAALNSVKSGISKVTSSVSKGLSKVLGSTTGTTGTGTAAEAGGEKSTKKKSRERLSDTLANTTKPKDRPQDDLGPVNIRATIDKPHSSVLTATEKRKNKELWRQKGEPLSESNLDLIKGLVKSDKKTCQIKFKDTSIPINKRIAKKLINVYESLNKENQAKFANMLNENTVSFKNVINFVVRQ